MAFHSVTAPSLEFTVRVEWELEAERDLSSLAARYKFMVDRVLLECDERDLLPVGELEVKRIKLDSEFKCQPYWLTFRPGLESRVGAHLVAIRRVELGIPAKVFEVW